MKMFRLFGALIMWPQNKTDRFLVDCMSNKTKARKVEVTAVHKKSGQLKGVMFCEFVKNCDATFKPWPEDSVMAKIQKGRDRWRTN